MIVGVTHIPMYSACQCMQAALLHHIIALLAPPLWRSSPALCTGINAQLIQILQSRDLLDDGRQTIGRHRQAVYH